MKLSKFDAADYLKTLEAREAYLAEALETGDASYIRHARGTITRAIANSQSPQDRS